MKEINIKNTTLMLFTLLNVFTFVNAEVETPLTNHAKIVADYLFNNNFKSSIAGAPDITFLGGDINFIDENVFGINRTVFKFVVETGFRLDVSSLISNNEYTIAVVFKIIDVERFVKILDFKNLLSDNGLYDFIGALIFSPDVEGENMPILANQFVQLIFTRDVNGLTKGYINKQLQFEFTDDGQDAVISNHNLLYILLDDDTTGNDENSDATIARVTLFDKAMSLTEIQDFPPLDIIYRNSFE